MEAIWDAIASFASSLWGMFDQAIAWVLSLVTSAGIAIKHFVTDWIFYGYDWARARQLALLAGYDIQIPTFGQLLQMAPQPMYQMFVRIGLLQAAQIIAGGITAWRWSMWLVR